MVDWLIDWLIDRLVDCLFVCLIDWLVGWSVVWLIGCFVDWLIGWLVRCWFLAGWLTGWLVGILSNCAHPIWVQHIHLMKQFVFMFMVCLPMLHVRWTIIISANNLTAYAWAVCFPEFVWCAPEPESQGHIYPKVNSSSGASKTSPFSLEHSLSLTLSLSLSLIPELCVMIFLSLAPNMTISQWYTGMGRYRPCYLPHWVSTTHWLRILIRPGSRAYTALLALILPNIISMFGNFSFNLFGVCWCACPVDWG